MAQPTGYSKTTDFSQDEANNVGGRSSIRTANLDGEFSNIQLTLSETLRNIALIQRDDGKLRDGLVELYNLSASARAALQSRIVARGLWATAVSYSAYDLVDVGGQAYLCATEHTSGVFAIDYTAGRWQIWNFDDLSALSFLQTGTGASSRVAQDKMREIVSILDFGAVADGATDNTDSIQNAIDYAASVGGSVLVPKAAALWAYDGDLEVPAGVQLIGQGRGQIVNGAGPTRGSVLFYRGTGHGIKLNGPLTGVVDLALKGTASALGAGVLVNGDGNAVESWLLRAMTIYGFTGGTGLKLQGINAGAVAYGSAIDLRIRNALCGIRITDTGGGSGFCNTNQWYGGNISGTGFQRCLHADGGNDNRFYGMSVEPPSSTLGHIYLENEADIEFHGRCEAVSQTATTPTVYVASTAKLKMTGLYGGTLIKNDSARSEISIVSSKVANSPGTPKNLLKNAAFAGLDVATPSLPNWTFSSTGAAPTYSWQAPELFDNSYVLRVDVPAGGTAQAGPDTATHSGGNITFGAWIKTDQASKVQVYIAAPGVASSTMHPGDSTWRSIGMGRSDASGTATCRILMDNSVGGSTATFYITAPFQSDSSSVYADLPAFTRNAGYLAGTIEGNSTTISLPAAGSDSFYSTTNNELTLPKWGNTIHLAGNARTINRINNITANRMAKGTIIRLVFDIAGIVITDSAFIDLTAAFTSLAPGSLSARNWLLLESVGDGTWYELDRRL